MNREIEDSEPEGGIMVQTDKTLDDSKRVGEMLGAMESARLFILDALQTCRFVFEKGLASAYEEPGRN